MPKNLDIIGTMNTADRSLALMDTALRRRLEFVPMLPDATKGMNSPLYGTDIDIDGQAIDVARMLERMNRRIEILYDRDHRIGHAYFMPTKLVTSPAEFLSKLAEIFQKKIIPLLEEYFFDDWRKIRLVLADNQKTQQHQLVREYPQDETLLTDLFGDFDDRHGLVSRERYEVQDSAFSKTGAYVGIYATGR